MTEPSNRHERRKQAVRGRPATPPLRHEPLDAIILTAEEKRWLAHGVGPYSCVRHHDAGPGAWALNGPEVPMMSVADRSIGEALAALLNGDIPAAVHFRNGWIRCGVNFDRRKEMLK